MNKIKKEDLAAIQKEAEALAAELPFEQQEGFKESFIASLVAMNEGLDAVIEQFEDTVTPLLVGLNSREPSKVLSARQGQSRMIRKCSIDIVAEANKACRGSSDIRGEIFEAIKRSLDSYQRVYHSSKISCSQKDLY